MLRFGRLDNGYIILYDPLGLERAVEVSSIELFKNKRDVEVGALLRNNRMRQNKSAVTSTAMIDCSWKTPSERRHLVIHGNPPYVMFVETVKTGKKNAEATEGAQLEKMRVAIKD